MENLQLSQPEVKIIELIRQLDNPNYLRQALNHMMRSEDAMTLKDDSDAFYLVNELSHLITENYYYNLMSLLHRHDQRE